VLFASSAGVRRDLGWRPAISSLDDIVRTAWRWRSAHPGGFGAAAEGLMSRLKGVLADPLLSVVIPVYNEQDTIEEILTRVAAVPVRKEILVVDDCSTDGTRARLAGLQGRIGFQLFLQDRNQGKGRALRRGFAEVAGDIVVIAGRTTSSTRRRSTRSSIALICEGRADVVYGSRFPGPPPGVPVHALPGNRLLTPAHQRALQHHAHRHGDVLQGDADGGVAVVSRCARTDSASSPS